MPPKSPKSPMEQVGDYMALAFLLPISVTVGYAIGYYLDQWLGTTYLRIVFLVLGVVSGFISLVKELQKREKKDGGAK